MMCEHEFVNATKGWMDKNKSVYPITESMQICRNCHKTVGEIDLEAKLEAAAAALAAERAKRETRPVLYWREKAEQAESKLKYEKESADALLVLNKSILRKAERAEAQCAYLIEAYCGECDYDHEICRGTQPDMQCAVRTLDDSASAKLLAELQRYREALEYYAGGAKYVQRPDGKVPISDDGGAIARAALSASSSAPAGEGAPPETRMIKINGHVEVNVSHEEFMDKLIAFIEANGWTFGGVTEEVSP